jgi:glycerophosphoryl diester phosphodiesterase
MLAFSVYFGANRLFTVMPHLLHPKRTGFQVPPKSPNLQKMIIAHRGGSWEAPENTLTAFKKAL